MHSYGKISHLLVNSSKLPLMGAAIPHLYKKKKKTGLMLKLWLQPVGIDFLKIDCNGKIPMMS